jgi:hypothetical protein
MKTIEEKRFYPWLDARWAVTYWNDELYGQGTVLRVCEQGCRIAGTMIVAEGMRLKLLMSPPNTVDELCVEEARVLWVKDYEFGLAFQRVTATDRQELAVYLQNAERRRSFQPLGQLSSTEDMATMALAVRTEVESDGRADSQRAEVEPNTWLLKETGGRH